MAPAATIAANDLRRRLRDRTFYVQGVIAPLVLAAIIGLAVGGGFSFRATIAVVDADGSELSRQLVSALTGEPVGDSPITFERVDPEQVDALVAAGTVDAAIVLPAGFGGSITGSAPASIGVVVDASKRITADVTTAVARRLVARLDGARLAIEAALRAAPQPTDAAQLERVIAEGQAATHLLEVRSEVIGGRYSPIAFYAPSMGMLFLFFTIGAGARSLIVERQQGTLSRLRAAPITDAQVLLGKTAGVLVLGLASLLVLWGVTSTAFHAAWGDPFAVLLVVVGVVVSTAGLSILVTAVARTEAQAQGLTSMVAFALALLGGNFLAPGSAPPVLAKLSLLTPNGWALRAFTNIGAADAGPVDVLPAVGVIVAIGLVAGTIGLRLLSGRATS